MPNTDTSREDDLRLLLTDAIEVQLAALKAGVSFWTEWIEHTSAFVQSASKTLSSINTDDPKSRDVVLELLDAGRASVRSLTEIPRNTASHFIAELDKFAAQKATASAAARSTRNAASSTASSAASGTTSGSATAKSAKRSAATRRKRAGRAKS